MAYFYRAPRIETSGAVAIGLLVAVCAFVLGWIVSDSLDHSRAESASTGTTAAPPSAKATVAGPTEDALTLCRQVYADQATPLAAARASMAQWVVHIDAMNRLVSGQITLAQATAFWDQTRIGAQAKLRAFTDAVSRYDDRAVRCPRGGSQHASADQACVAAVAARNRQISRARTALATWRMHVGHMEMLRRGEMTASQATALWQTTWHQGQAEVTAYRAAASAARGLRC